MTNNKVIIDGVDVVKCEQYMTDFKLPNNIEGGYYTHHNICECGTQGVENFNFFCKDNPNCYYKQLQRKTAECKKLKEEIVQIKKDLRERFKIQNVSDNDIIITCPKKQTCYEHLHAHEALVAYRKADKKLQRKTAECEKLKEEIKEFKEDLKAETYCTTCQKENENNSLLVQKATLEQDLKKYKSEFESYFNSYKQSCECNRLLNDKIAELHKQYEIAQVSATRARNIGNKYKSALEEIEKIITPTVSIGGLELSADKVDKIQEIILKTKEQE